MMSARRGIYLICAFGALSAASAAGQDPGDLPTLADLGLGYISPSGTFQLDLSGQLDVEGYVPEESPPWLIPTDDAFVAGRMRLFADVFWTDRVYGLVELRIDRGEEPTNEGLEARFDQAFVRLQPFSDAALHVEVGKFVSPFGGYAGRHGTSLDPFIRPPLVHEFRTMLPTDKGVNSVVGLLRWKDEPERWRATGAPPLWGVPYQWGAMLLGGLGPFSVRAALLNSAPASPPEAWGLGDEAPPLGSTPALNLGVQLTPALRAEVSWTKGPYLARGVENIDPELGIDYYVQEIWGGEIVFMQGPLMLRGEVFHDFWKVPRVKVYPVEISYYLEGQMDLFAGLWGAVRYSAIDFLPLSDHDLEHSNTVLPPGVTRDWDYDVSRWQFGMGYRFARNGRIQAEYDWNLSEAPVEPSDNLFSAQLSWMF